MYRLSAILISLNQNWRLPRPLSAPLPEPGAVASVAPAWLVPVDGGNEPWLSVSGLATTRMARARGCEDMNSRRVKTRPADSLVDSEHRKKSKRLPAFSERPHPHRAAVSSSALAVLGLKPGWWSSSSHAGRVQPELVLDWMFAFC